MQALISAAEHKIRVRHTKCTIMVTQNLPGTLWEENCFLRINHVLEKSSVCETENSMGLSLFWFWFQSMGTCFSKTTKHPWNILRVQDLIRNPGKASALVSSQHHWWHPLKHYIPTKEEQDNLLKEDSDVKSPTKYNASFNVRMWKEKLSNSKEKKLVAK